MKRYFKCSKGAKQWINTTFRVFAEYVCILLSFISLTSDTSLEKNEKDIFDNFALHYCNICICIISSHHSWISLWNANQHQATIPAMLNVHHMLKICRTSGTSADVKDLPHPFKLNSEQPPPQSWVAHVWIWIFWQRWFSWRVLFLFLFHKFSVEL